MAPGAGHVYIIGAGPGDPGLITVAGERAIARADVIYYDALAAPALLRSARPGAELVYVGKRSGQHALQQHEIEELMVRVASEGRAVARLKGGDPFVFGRGGEEALACRRAGVQFTVSPGISSAIAGPAYAGIPVTHRGLANAFLVVTGNDAGEETSNSVDWQAAARADTLVILMGVATLAENMRRLAAAGRDPSTPAALIRWGTRPDQQVVLGTVGTIAGIAAAARIASPVVTVVGAVASLASQLDWYHPGPLAGKRVVVTRARAQSSELTHLLEQLGALVVEAPVVAMRPCTPSTELREALLAASDWIVWTSANGVRACAAELVAAGLDARALAGRNLAAVGSATTGALREWGLWPDFVPSRATSASLAAELPGVDGRSILLAVSALTDGRMARALRARGARVRQVAAYDNVIEPLDEERRREVADADAITFTSASTARNLRDALGQTPAPEKAKLVSIGAQTSAAVMASFGRLDREAAEPDLESLVQAVVESLA